jgi:hypothetical protein
MAIRAANAFHRGARVTAKNQSVIKATGALKDRSSAAAPAQDWDIGLVAGEDIHLVINMISIAYNSKVRR